MDVPPPYPGQAPLLATAQSPQPSTAAPASGSGGQIVTAIYPPSPSVTMATGVVSMAPVPPSVVYSVSNPSSASPHILPKHTTAPSTVMQLHLPPHPDRQADRHLPPDRSADRQSDRQPDRQVDILAHSDRQVERQNISYNSNSSAAPPSGSAASIRPSSPPLQIQAPGRTASSFSDEIMMFWICLGKKNTFLWFTGSTPKLLHLPVRLPQKVKATVATIPVGSYDGGGRGKDRERDKEREKEREREREREKEREREAAANSNFSFEPEPSGHTGSPAAHPSDEPPSSDTPLEGSSTADSSDPRNRESTTTKEVKRDTLTLQHRRSQQAINQLISWWNEVDNFYLDNNC